ncbi:MAG: hypothetical protein ACPGJS_17605 [Flammeovirgaceae bacterium]
MKQFLFILLAIVALSCSSNYEKPAHTVQNQQQKDSLVNVMQASYELQLSQVYNIPANDYIAYYLKLDEITYETRTSDSYSYEKSYSRDWNMLFYNTVTQKYHTLFQQNQQVIEKSYLGTTSLPTTSDLFEDEYATEEVKKEPNSASQQFLFFEVIHDDFTADGLLTYKDPTYLYRTDLMGKNLRQLSPKNYDVINWGFPKNNSLLVMTTRKDSNRDKKFTEHDQTVIWGIDILADQPAYQLFPDSYLDSLKKQYLESLIKVGKAPKG